MALIGKIREKSWLLVAVIGIAMLAFILGDLESVFSGSGREDLYGIGTVNGEKVDEESYNNVLQNVRNQIFQNKNQDNQSEQPVPLDENDEKTAFNQAWSGVVGEILLEKEFDKIGLIVDEIELENVLYGEENFNPSPAISSAQMFQDSTTGEFNSNLVRQYIQNLEDSNDPEAAENLKGTLEYVRQNRLRSKYNTLLSAGIHATTIEGKEEYIGQKTVKNITYAYKKLNEVPSDITENILEDEVIEFYEANKDKKKYRQKASRKIKYFTVPVHPTKSDTLAVKKFLESRIEPFKKAKDDSIFVMRFSDVKTFSNDESAVYHREGTRISQEAQAQSRTYPISVAEEIENAEIGDVVGPYFSGEFMTLSKVVRFVDAPLASVRHILLNAQGDEEVAKAQKKADSIVRVIRAKNNFGEMVKQFSGDQPSIATGGKYENFVEGTMVPEFNDFSFNKPIGSLGTVKTTYGIHIIEVLDRKTPKRPILASVKRPIKVTKTSVDNVNGMATSLIFDIDDLMEGKSLEEKNEIFDTFAVNNGYNIRTLTIMDENPETQGFGQAAKGRLLRLAYEEGNEPGTLASSTIRDKDRIVIAYLADVKEEGIPPFNNIKDRMFAEVKKEKQAQYIKEQLLGDDNLENISTQAKAKLESEGVTFSANNVNVGRELKIIGVAFSGLPDGGVSIPVKGNTGVFKLRVDSTVEPPETTDFSTEQAQLKSQNRSTLMQQYQIALINSADVIDNRVLRSYGVR